MNRSLLKKLVLLWLGWGLILLAFQHWAVMRLNVAGPDKVLDWTAAETYPGAPSKKYYLSDPFMNTQVAWDSEYYLSIAVGGYDDPKVQAVAGDYGWQNEHFCTPGYDEDCYSLNYAYFPLYPLSTRALSTVLHVMALGLSPVAAATLAGVLVSLLGTLGAMIGLCSLLLPLLGEEGSLRAVFFMLVFPSGFFLGQVYTEGLFLGLTFGALACMQERKWGWAALLAALATWTRPGRSYSVIAFCDHLVAGPFLEDGMAASSAARFGRANPRTFLRSMGAHPFGGALSFCGRTLFWARFFWRWGRVLNAGRRHTNPCSRPVTRKPPSTTAWNLARCCWARPVVSSCCAKHPH